jgi:glycosyltransferase involved in cell wall biosynthesis
MKKVAILLSTYNGERYLREFLNSLIDQRYKDFDVIVRDDLSSDSTIDIIREFDDRLSVRLISSEHNLGPARSFMRLLEQAGSGYSVYMFADQDDYWQADKISRCVSHFESLDLPERPTLYFTTLELVDEKLAHIRYTTPALCFEPECALVENVVTGCSAGINRAAREAVLKGANAAYAMHDWWVFIVIAFFGRIYCDAEPTIRYRQHGANVVGAATGAIDDFIRKARRFIKSARPDVVPLSRQAQSFLDIYRFELTPGQQQLVRLVCERDKSLLRSVYLFFFAPFRRQRRMDSLILRVMFLIGRY